MPPANSSAVRPSSVAATASVRMGDAMGEDEAVQGQGLHAPRGRTPLNAAKTDIARRVARCAPRVHGSSGHIRNGRSILGNR
jgi:hypothetical protein